MMTTKNLICLSVCIQLIVLASANSCSYALYDEFLPLSSIQNADVKTLCAKQLQAISVENIVGQNKVTLEGIKGVSSYDGSKRQLSWKQLTQTVKDEKIKISLTYNASIKKSLSTTHYNVTTTIQFVTVNFEKIYDQKTGVPRITAVNAQFAATDFKNVFTPNANSGDAKLLAEVITSVSGPSIYASLSKIFAKFEQQMQQNCKNERLSKQYPNGIYYYTYNKDVAIFDMEANGISIQGNTLHLGYNGIIKDSNPQSCTEQRIAQLNDYHTFISKQFMENFVQYATKNFKQFLQVRINNQTCKPVVFHFRLVSLESVVPKAVERYKDYELQPVSFTCHAQHLNYFHLGDLQNPTFADILWRCEGYLEVAGQAVKILDFEPEVRHFARFQIENDEMGVFVTKAILNKISYNVVDDFQVTGEREAQFFINDVLGDMTTWTVGTQFKVRQGLNEIKYGDRGIWLTSPLGLNKQVVMIE